MADSFFSLVFAEERHDLRPDEDTYTCRFVKPRTDSLCAIRWSNSGGRDVGLGPLANAWRVFGESTGLTHL